MFIVKKIAAFFFVVIIISSCESILHISGHVYDYDTKVPLHGVKITLLLKGNDTVTEMHIYDTINKQQRITLRENGIKDDYLYDDSVGFYKIKHSYITTKKDGSFDINGGIVGCVPDCPRVHLILAKDSFQAQNIETGNCIEDTTIYLKRMHN